MKFLFSVEVAAEDYTTLDVYVVAHSYGAARELALERMKRKTKELAWVKRMTLLGATDSSQVHASVLLVEA